MPGSHYQNKSGAHLERSSRARWIEEVLNEVPRSLPALRPLSHYEHDHPLRHLLHLDFADALKCIQDTFEADSLLSPTEYADYCRTGRIDPLELAALIDESLRSNCRDETLVSDPVSALRLGTRSSLRKAMIVVPELVCEHEPEAWVESLIVDSRQSAPAMADTATKDFQDWLAARKHRPIGCDEELLLYLERDTIGRPLTKWSPVEWNLASDYATWWYCQRGCRDWLPPFTQSERVRQTISRLLPAIDDEIRRLMVPFLSAYVDPGVAAWRLPNHEATIFEAFADWFAQAPRTAFGSRQLHLQLTEMLKSHAQLEPEISIESSLRALQVSQLDALAYIQDAICVVRGWTGLMYHLSISEYPCRDALRKFSLPQLIAVLLLLDRGAMAQRLNVTGERVPVIELSKSLQKQHHVQQRSQATATRKTWMFRLARHLNWSPAQLQSLIAIDWSTIHHELNSFPKFERQWVAQQAFEYRYRQSVFTALTHRRATSSQSSEAAPPAFMLITCAEPSQESIRRHVQAICPGVETVGVPGFFNLDVKFKDCQSSHYVPHAPANIRKRHLISETEMEPPFKPSTLEIEQTIVEPSSLAAHTDMTSSPLNGFTIAEMATVVSRLLIDSGIAHRLPRVVLIMGHKSSSVNNLYETADNCTFCSKHDVQVNTRVFVQMANDYRVRQAMKLEGAAIPETTLFVGAVHHTCSDRIVYLEPQPMPASHIQELETIVPVMQQAAKRNAIERLEQMAEPASHADRALQHCEEREQSGAFARPEYSLMGNALCFIGRRQLTRDLKLDRRPFLFSYDPRQDDDLSVLARLLAVNLPVLANISFDYWFSRVAPERFGAGRKAELKLIAHMGVTDTEYGDLRVGLPFEMVDKHEPMRLQVIVDASPDQVGRMLAASPRVSRFFTRAFMHLSVYHEGKIFERAIGQKDDWAKR